MRKSFNTMRGGYERALENLQRHEIRLYVTFILGYDGDHGDTLQETLAFAERHRFYIVAFNHLTPFPGTPLYDRLEREGRLLYDRWWLDPGYRYGMVPFTPRGMTAEDVKQRCIEARQKFYSLRSILKRSANFSVNSRNLFMWSHFFSINLCSALKCCSERIFRSATRLYSGDLLKADHPGPLVLSELAVS